jgi:hypothetical protein
MMSRLVVDRRLLERRLLDLDRQNRGVGDVLQRLELLQRQAALRECLLAHYRAKCTTVSVAPSALRLVLPQVHAGHYLQIAPAESQSMNFTPSRF